MYKQADKQKTHKEENKIKTKVRCESSICVWTYEATPTQLINFEIKDCVDIKNTIKTMGMIKADYRYVFSVFWNMDVNKVKNRKDIIKQSGNASYR
ncbi:hypothetical protein AGMMS49921_03230 [Endomicrobiia bacterium]|nr:hypothetical protein AGMMS49921_03230 [Endomicrobiia bacterium]